MSSPPAPFLMPAPPDDVSFRTPKEKTNNDGCGRLAARRSAPISASAEPRWHVRHPAGVRRS